MEKLEQSMSALEHSPRGNVSVNMLCALRSESQSPVGDIVEWYRVRLTSIEFNKVNFLTNVTSIKYYKVNFLTNVICMEYNKVNLVTNVISLK